jgi:hypothetical protein
MGQAITQHMIMRAIKNGPTTLTLLAGSIGVSYATLEAAARGLEIRGEIDVEKRTVRDSLGLLLVRKRGDTRKFTPPDKKTMKKLWGNGDRIV